jgi:hypothetical protein
MTEKNPLFFDTFVESLRIRQSVRSW